MRLTHIKLAGFKSFVDPTTIPVPGQLVAVCGPNGCGKSNVIDAVRWVLGESSAKQLRGESMQDVIFNGSTTRKAVSRTAVELVFDNHAGLAAGAWSAYAEISIKRVLTRQGDSSYFINNQAVRRRDITDLFLGTGVGKSGYAIIEQGMISRIIEAKPEELRHFLEEAAGVSKYKERRRETEHRIADTRDNLLRVADIQLELQRQIDKLSSQAGVAQQYQSLQNQITEKQQLLALQRKIDAGAEAEQASLALMQAQTNLDAALACVRETEAQLEILRETHFIASDALHAAQGELYTANAEVARMEQTLLHIKQSRERISAQISQCEQDGNKLNVTQAQIAADLAASLEQQDELNFAVEEAALKVEEASLALPDHEQALHQADAAWQALREQLSELANAQKLLEQQAQFATRNLQTLAQRRNQLDAELQRLAPPQTDSDLPEQISDAQYEIAELELQLEEHTALQQTCDLALQQIRRVAQDAQTELLQSAARETALLEVLVPASTASELDAWLAEQDLQHAAKIIDGLRVEPGWELALEAVLGSRVHGIMAAPPLCAPPASLFMTMPDAEGMTQSAALIAADSASLFSKISNSTPALLLGLQDVLTTVRCVENVEQLLQQQKTLIDGYCLVSKEGHIATRYTLWFFAADRGDGEQRVAGQLARQAELRAVQSQLSELRPRHALIASEVQAQEGAQIELQQAQRTLEDQLQQRKHALQQIEHQWLRQQDSAQQSALRRAEVAAELQLNEQQQMEESQLHEELAQQMTELQQRMAHLQADELQTRSARDGLHQSQNQHSVQVREIERAAQAAAFALQSAEQKIRTLQQRALENQALLSQQAERLAALLQERDLMAEPDFDDQFQAAIGVRAEKERLLAAARDALNQFAQTLREQEANKQQAEQGLEAQREVVNQMRLLEQEARLNFERFSAELTELAINEAELLPQLGRSVKALAAEMARLSQQLASLGPVNLAAMQELAVSQERDAYLKAQASDLEQAMATLSSAIARIDKETRNLLQTTYDAVNANLQELFPALFGGGHAELILTGDEILDAGMSIMAQPPGKKNATIHLLSGGEKALTALSLVFSLFKLNPAPFCLLDEVDAPLDDANTLRFCELVKKMAQHTQFLYISHNKLTMEMAQQLVGVTMQEQGVSRIVAVDIEAALKMREPELI
ncbi:chromosome segregation protein SMC [Deefgea rivuli]|uniref:chromosome segregation protein SMC n=1 Tax=Deefgea rivuli TaxID=400948 RepID=UPI000486E8FD|nr:chromosome segregation protein SMC [Deefgea rivuli]